jgi:hypothetical protein
LDQGHRLQRLANPLTVCALKVKLLFLSWENMTRLQEEVVIDTWRSRYTIFLLTGSAILRFSMRAKSSSMEV